MTDNAQLVTLTADIVAAHVSNNRVAVGDVANLVQQVHGALAGLGASEAPAEPEQPAPAMSARASVKADSIGCMVCGSRQKTLKRHLTSAHGMTPQEYRARFDLPDSYPMVSPDYSAARRQMALNIGLGSKRRGSARKAK